MYENSIAELTPLFNHINQLDGSSTDAEALNTATLQRQLGSFRQGRTGCKIYESICIDSTLLESRRQHRDTLDVIEETAISLGIELRLSTSDAPLQQQHANENPTNLSLKRSTKPPRSQEQERESSFSDDDSSSANSSESDSSTDSESEFASESDISFDSEAEYEDEAEPSYASSPRTPRRNLSRFKPAQLPSPPSSGGSSRPKAQQPKPRKYNKSPRLLYRWYRDSSQGLNSRIGFRAGLFVSPSTPIPEPSWPYDTVRNHLVPEKQLSPYISFRDNMRAGMRRALQLSDTNNACIAVADFETLKDSVGEAGLRAAPELVQEFELKLQTKRGLYSGGGEWLVYGKRNPSR